MHVALPPDVCTTLMELLTMGCKEQENTAGTDKFILGQSRTKPKFKICQQLSSSKEKELRLRDSTLTSHYEKLKLPVADLGRLVIQV